MYAYLSKISLNMQQLIRNTIFVNIHFLMFFGPLLTDQLNKFLLKAHAPSAFKHVCYDFPYIKILSKYVLSTNTVMSKVCEACI